LFNSLSQFSADFRSHTIKGKGKRKIIKVHIVNFNAFTEITLKKECLEILLKIQAGKRIWRNLRIFYNAVKEKKREYIEFIVAENINK
jgi:hypothetical protein